MRSPENQRENKSMHQNFKKSDKSMQTLAHLTSAMKNQINSKKSVKKYKIYEVFEKSFRNTYSSPIWSTNQQHASQPTQPSPAKPTQQTNQLASQWNIASPTNPARKPANTQQVCQPIRHPESSKGSLQIIRASKIQTLEFKKPLYKASNSICEES